MHRMLTPFALASALVAGAAAADEHVVEMLNKGPDGDAMVFEPAVIHVEPGDTVTFIPVDRGHNVESVRGALPDEVAPFRGGMNQEFTIEIAETGVHLVKFTPHFGMGMIALIVSGDDFSNLASVEASLRPRKARQRFVTYLAEARGDAES
jgi:pseudoazurin